MYNRNFIQKQKGTEKGQNLVELALVLPFLIIIVFGVLDLGRIFFASINLTNAAREGVRFLTMHPNDVANAYMAYWGSKSAAIEEASFNDILLSPVDVSVDCVNEDENDEFCDSGTPAEVVVTHNFELILGWLLSDSITITRRAVMIVP